MKSRLLVFVARFAIFNRFFQSGIEMITYQAMENDTVVLDELTDLALLVLFTAQGAFHGVPPFGESGMSSPMSKFWTRNIRPPGASPAPSISTVQIQAG